VCETSTPTVIDLPLVVAGDEKCVCGKRFYVRAIGLQHVDRVLHAQRLQVLGEFDGEGPCD